jgi:hypothetical protein
VRTIQARPSCKTSSIRHSEKRDDDRRPGDVAVGFGGAGGYLEMNVYKLLILDNVTHSAAKISDGCVNFRRFPVEGTKPNLTKIKWCDLTRDRSRHSLKSNAGRRGRRRKFEW